VTGGFKDAGGDLEVGDEGVSRRTYSVDTIFGLSPSSYRQGNRIVSPAKRGVGEGKGSRTHPPWTAADLKSIGH